MGRTREEELSLSVDGEWKGEGAERTLGGRGDVVEAGRAKVLSQSMGETREEAGGRGW